jgi:hypothetical protein
MTSATHPSPQLRMAKLAASLARSMEPMVARWAIEFGQVVQWTLCDLWSWLKPAFLAAHRNGQTERVTIREYTEKESYLDWFLANAFNVDVSALGSVTDENVFDVRGKLRANTLAALAVAYRRQHGLY